MSYQLQNKNLAGKETLAVDTPFDELWSNYRLQKSKMELIMQNATEWRFTCRYDTDGLKYTDYARFSKEIINPLTQSDPWACVQVEYINVRGYECSKCTVSCRQYAYQLTVGSMQQCAFSPPNKPACDPSFREDAFGIYGCVSPQHRCSSSPT